LTPEHSQSRHNNEYGEGAAPSSDFQVRIGGLRIGVTCDDNRVGGQLRTEYAPWLSDGPAGCELSGCDCTVAVRCVSGERMPGRPSPEASFDSDHQCQMVAPGYLGSIAADGRSARLELAAPNVADVDYFLRAVLAVLAYERGGLLVHAAGFLRSDQAVLLSGRSGIGKSTAVRVSVGLPETTALGDDLILLLPAAAGWQAHGTPFWNHETPMAWRAGQTRAGRLVGVFRLVQDSQVRIQALSAASIVAGLISDLPIVPLDPGRVTTLLTRLRQISQTVRAGHLHFRPNAGFWSVIDETICPVVVS
jgi:hypothetical protein